MSLFVYVSVFLTLPVLTTTHSTRIDAKTFRFAIRRSAVRSRLSPPKNREVGQNLLPGAWFSGLHVATTQANSGNPEQRDQARTRFSSRQVGSTEAVSTSAFASKRCSERHHLSPPRFAVARQQHGRGVHNCAWTNDPLRGNTAPRPRCARESPLCQKSCGQNACSVGIRLVVVEESRG